VFRSPPLPVPGVSNWGAFALIAAVGLVTGRTADATAVLQARDLPLIPHAALIPPQPNPNQTVGSQCDQITLISEFENIISIIIFSIDE